MDAVPAPDRRPSQAYPKEARLRLRRDFLAVRARSRRVVGAQCVIRVARSERARARLGVAAPRAYGKAVRRNRFRRLVRAAFRQVAGALPPLDLLVEPRRDLVEPTLEGIAQDLRRAAGPR